MSKNDTSPAPQQILSEAAVYKVTPTRIFAYKRRSTDPSKIQTVQIRHGEVWKHYKDLVDPPPGYKVIGHIGPNYGHPDDIQLADPSKPIGVEPDSEAVTSKGGDKKYVEPGTMLHGKGKKAAAPEPQKEPEPEPEPEVQAEPEPQAEPEVQKEPDPAPVAKPAASEDDVQAAYLDVMNQVHGGAKIGKIKFLKFVQQALAGKTHDLGQLVAAWKKWEEAGVLSTDVEGHVTVKPQGLKIKDPEAEPQPEPPAEEPVAQEPAPEEPKPEEPKPEKKPSFIDQEVWDKAGGTFMKAAALQHIVASGKNGIELDPIYKAFADANVNQLVVDAILQKFLDAGVVHGDENENGTYVLKYGEKPVATPEPEPEPVKVDEPADDIHPEAVRFFLSNWGTQAAKAMDLDLEQKKVLAKFMHQAMDSAYGAGTSQKVVDLFKQTKAKSTPDELTQLKNSNHTIMSDTHGVSWVVNHPLAKEALAGFNAWKDAQKVAPDEPVEPAPEPKADEPEPAASPETDTKEPPKEVDVAVPTKPVPAPLTANTPSKITAFGKNETGMFHPEDFAILDNRLVLRKYFTELKNKYYADKKEKEVHAYMAQKYGPEWKDAYDKLQTALKSTLSKHAYYKKSQLGYHELVSAYGDDWISNHPTLAAVWAGQTPESPPVFINQPKTDEVPKPLTPEEILDAVDTSKALHEPFSKHDFLTYALLWSPASVAMEKAESFATSDKFFEKVNVHLKSKYKVKNLTGLSQAQFDWVNSIGVGKFEELQKATAEKLKKAIGDHWYHAVPLFKTANEPAPAVTQLSPEQDGGKAPGTKSVLTSLTHEDTKIFHPEDHILYQYGSQLYHQWAKDHGKDVAEKRRAALHAYFGKKYGQGWMQASNELFGHICSKKGSSTGTLAHTQAFNELKDAYGDSWSEKHPSILAALKDLPDTKPAAITAQDLLPGKATKFSAFTQEQAKNFHPEDLFLLMNRHNVLNAWYSKYSTEEASEKFGKWMAYYKSKYGDLALKQAGDIKHDLSNNDDFMEVMAKAEAEMKAMYGAQWQFDHPTVVATFKGESPPQALGTNASHVSKGSYKDFTPNGPSVVKSITPEMAGGWHPEELILWGHRQQLKDAVSDAKGDLEADDWYDQLFNYYNHKYGDNFLADGDDLFYKIKAKGHFTSGTEELVSHYGYAWKNVLKNHPVATAITAGIKPESVNIPANTANIPLKSTPSKFDPYSEHGADIGKFEPHDFALLSQVGVLWKSLKEKHGSAFGDPYTKIMHYLQAKYGDDAQSVVKALAATHGHKALSQEAISTHLKSAYGQNWIDAHPTIVAALSGEKPATSDQPEPTAVTPADAVAHSAPKKAKKSTSIASGISDPEPFKGTVPAGKDLKFHSDASHLGGAFQKSIYTDSSGKKWLFKPAITGAGKKKVYSAYGAQAFSSISQKIKPNHIPIAKTEVNGVEGTVQPLLEGENGKLKTLAGIEPSDLTPIEREDVAAEHLLDWLFSQHDTHAKNLIRTPDGHILGIDKDQTFRFLDTDKLSLDYHPNEGEGSPYYNQFWNAWAQSDFEFEPTSLSSYIAKIEAVTPQEYEAAIMPYAQTLFPNNYEDQALFLQRAKNRKNGIRSEFEKFITNLYKTKTKKEGKFTFDGGWDGPSNVKAPGPMAKKTKYSGLQMLSQKSGKVVSYTDKSGNADPNKVTLKMHAQPDAVNAFLKELNITPLSPVKVGSTYTLAFLNKADWENSFVEKVETIEPVYAPSTKFPPTPPKPKYLPQIDIHAKNVTPNAHELHEIGNAPIPYSGHAFHVGGAAVESQSVRVKKHVGTNGKPYYRVMFKLLPKYANKVSGGTHAKHGLPMGSWDDNESAFKDDGEYSLKLDTKTWNDGDSSVHFYNDKTQYAYMNMVFADIRPKKGQSFAEAFHSALKQMNPDVAEAVTRDPTPEEQEVAKLARLLWSHAPQAADQLKEHDYTKAGLVQKLKENGIKAELADKIQTVHTAPGYVSHVLPGYWKEAKDAQGVPLVRFAYHSATTPKNILNQVKNGILGIVERLASGLPPKGQSLPEDIQTGGADNIYTRIATKVGDLKACGEDASVSGDYHMIIAPDELDRLDAYGHSGDLFGVCNPYHHGKGSSWKNRSTMKDLLTKIGKNFHGSNEVDFRKGISPSRILRIATNDEYKRATLIQTFKDGGLLEVNGVPVEDFVVVAHTQGEIFEKYVKPLGF